MTEHAKSHRFQILITQLSQALMIPFGVTRRQAYAQLQDGKLHIRFGPMFNERIRIENIASAEMAHWPRWAGVGLRTNLRGSVGLVGSVGNTVKLTLKEPQPVHLFLFPAKCESLYMSLEDPEGFLEAIGMGAHVKHARAKAA
jgi:hypothetical protein